MSLALKSRQQQLEYLKARAQLLKRVRDFFDQRDVLEIDTPLLCHNTATDPYITSIKTQPMTHSLEGKIPLYLQTSPEFAMKKILADHSGPIFQICKAFRDDEESPLHHFEFTMLEWYRPEFDHHQLMSEISDLLKITHGIDHIERYHYRDVFIEHLSLDPFNDDINNLIECASRNKIELNDAENMSVDNWLDLLFTHLIQPKLINPIFIDDYPPSQAALAKIRYGKTPVAERFELFINGVEHANGYHELIDAEEQQQRFTKDNQQRQQLQLEQVPIDNELITALNKGIPNCAGVAIGVDRLVLLLVNI